MNGLLRKGNVNVCIAGSNSRFLSSDIATEFRGRGEVIEAAHFSAACLVFIAMSHASSR